jgi:hypothetical protein
MRFKSIERVKNTTVPPKVSNLKAMDFPIPLPEPVTTATLEWKLN